MVIYGVTFYEQISLFNSEKIKQIVWKVSERKYKHIHIVTDEKSPILSEKIKETRNTFPLFLLQKVKNYSNGLWPYAHMKALLALLQNCLRR